MAGIWTPNGASDPATRGPIGIANIFYAPIMLSNGRAGLAVDGWSFSGFGTSQTFYPVKIALFEQNPDGTLSLRTDKYLPDASTNGAGSVIVADFNSDSKPDIFLAAHNESPFIAKPSTAYLSNSAGTFDKVTIDDHVEAHDASLALVDGVPTVFTASFDGDPSPYYQFRDGHFVVTPTASVSGFHTEQGYPFSVFAGTNSIAVADFGGDGEMEAVLGDLVSGPGYQFVPGKAPGIGIYELSDLAVVNWNASPKALLTPYFNDKPQYANVGSLSGPGQTHTFRLWIDDFNHDGLPDILAGTSLWPAPYSMLQMFQNGSTAGVTAFADKTAALNSGYGVYSQEVDYSLQMVDIDNSGIKSYFLAGNTVVPLLPNGNPDDARQANYILLNDGTGKLHVYMHNEFQVLGEQVNAFLSPIVQLPIAGQPRFIEYLTNEGTINLVAEVAYYPTTPSGQILQHAFVNVPLALDPARDFTDAISVLDRNGSKLIRTWAGNDTIFDRNSAGTAHIDGGIGMDTVVYAGSRSAYAISKTDAMTVVTGQHGTDQLVSIELAQFSDATIDLRPALSNDAYVVQQGRILSANTSTGVLLNDEAGLTAALATGPAHGAAVLSPTGGFTYSPAAGFSGIDRFTYQVGNAGSATDEAQVTIHVVPVSAGSQPTLNLVGLTAEEQVAATYAAFFGRGADAGGLDFWVGQFVSNLPTQGPAALFANIASSFGISAEAKALYPFLVDPFHASDGQISAFLNSVYDNLFNRTPDAGGLGYWTDQVKLTLQAGQFVGSVLVNIMSGAQDTAAGQDITTLMGKVAVSLAYVREQHEHVGEPTDMVSARALLEAVTADPASVLVGVKNAEALIASHG